MTVSLPLPQTLETLQMQMLWGLILALIYRKKTWLTVCPCRDFDCSCAAATRMLRVTARRLARRMGGTKPVAAASNVPAPTPDDWQEVPDTASGKSYWWNKKTNETTAVGAPKPGPDPWEQVQDSSGQTYWWNKQTNQTTALGAPKPSALQPPPEAGAPAMAGGGLRGALMDGLAWGVGTSVASRMMDGILGPRQMEVVHRNEDGSGAAGGDASPPPPGSAPDSGFGGGDSWYGDSNTGGSDESGGGWFGGGGDDGGDGGGGWFGGGDDEW
eukprot:s77_g7.t1